MTDAIRLALPDVGEEELNEIREVFTSGYLTQGPKVAEFEQIVADYIGVDYAFGMSSATTALHLSLVVLDIGAGDEVLVPDFTFPATANVVVQQGATPILVDVNLDTYTIDVDDLEAKVTPHSKAVMPVHAFGLSADMAPLTALAEKSGLAVIEDAACAIGTTYHEAYCGSIGTLGCFSFHPRKVITTGEGGMITTNDGALAERIRLLRSHGGIRRDGRFKFEAAGFNYRLSDVQGAIGVAQMRKLDKLIVHKRALALRYTELLNDVPGITPPTEPAWGGHIYQSYVVLLDEAIDRDQLIMRLREKGIETTLGTYALHAQPFFQKSYHYQAGDLPKSNQLFNQSLTLPLHTQMDEQTVSFVSETLANELSKN